MLTKGNLARRGTPLRSRSYTIAIAALAIPKGSISVVHLFNNPILVINLRTTSPRGHRVFMSLYAFLERTPFPSSSGAIF